MKKIVAGILTVIFILLSSCSTPYEREKEKLTELLDELQTNPNDKELIKDIREQANQFMMQSIGLEDEEIVRYELDMAELRQKSRNAVGFDIF